MKYYLLVNIVFDNNSVEIQSVKRPNLILQSKSCQEFGHIQKYSHISPKRVGDVMEKMHKLFQKAK